MIFIFFQKRAEDLYYLPDEIADIPRCAFPVRFVDEESLTSDHIAQLHTLIGSVTVELQITVIEG